MRQIATIFAAVLLALAVPTSAEAAIGSLVINGFTYPNPHGCYGPGHTHLTVVNHTNQSATIYVGKNCDDRVDRTLAPGQSAYTNVGKSVYVP